MGRKPKNVVSEESVSSNQEEVTPGLTLSIDSPDDVVEESGVKSILQKAKDFLKIDAPKEEGEEESTAPKRGRKKKVEAPSFTFQQYSPMMSLAVITWLAYVTDEKYKKLLPTKNQANDMLLPWCRIVDRHTKITQVNPDVSDIMVSLAAMVAYGFDAHSTYILMKEEEEEEKKKYVAKRENPIPFANSYLESIKLEQSNDQGN